MRSILALLATVVLACAASAAPAGAPDLAVAIVYDTSGSMKESIVAENGRRAPKFMVANAALGRVAKALEHYARGPQAEAPRQVEAALFTFSGEEAKQVLPLRPLDAKALETWAAGFQTPNGDTPLGKTLRAAAETLLKSKAARKHILVITDGINTKGPKPESVLPPLMKRASASGADLGIHFVAFDVDAKVFAPLRNQGVTIVSAANEQQLNAQLDYIIQKKILLEDEETPQSSK